MPSWWFGDDSRKFGDLKSPTIVENIRVYRAEDCCLAETAPAQPVLASQRRSVSRGRVDRMANKLLAEHPGFDELNITGAAKQIADLMTPRANPETVRKYITASFRERKRTASGKRS
jgi:hypothetical protein